MKSPTETFFDEYRPAAAEGAVLELKMRLLADKTPELKRFAHAQKLQDIEDAICSHFVALITDEDKRILSACRHLRNKILHCNFGVARDTLNELGVETNPSSVRAVRIDGLSPPAMAEKMANAMAGVSGSYELVAGTTTAQAGVYGWLLEMAASGNFRQAVDVFSKAAALITKLAAHGGTTGA